MTSSLDAGKALQIAFQYHRAGRLSDAEMVYRSVLERDPNRHEALQMLGVLAWQTGELEVASKLIGRALLLNPKCAEAHNNLGNVLQGQGHVDQAMAAFCKAIALKPDYLEAHYNLANLHQACAQFDEAISLFRRALTLSPSYAMAWSNLGNALTSIGQIDEAIAACRRAIELDPQLSSAHTNLGFALSLHPDFDTSAIRNAYRGWYEWYARPRIQPSRAHGNDLSPDRRLRIGYVSPDFRCHVVGSNLLPLLREHDRRHFEIFCYSNVLYPDALTDEIRSLSDGWRNIVSVSDESAVETIRADEIDILVDLASHTEGNRSLLVAARPAPIQLSYLGSIAPNGLEAGASRLSDSYLHPLGEDPDGAGKATIRLATSYWCYEPLGSSPEPSPLPALVTGGVTFGCLANFPKVSKRALNLWMDILRRSRYARLIIHAPEGSCRTRVSECFISGGVAPQVLEFVGRHDWEAIRADLAEDRHRS